MKTTNELIYMFKEVNPSYKRLFMNKGQRSALERMVEEHGASKVEKMIAYLPNTLGEKYAPVITTPVQLEYKLGSLIAYIQRNKEDKSNIAII